MKYPTERQIKEAAQKYPEAYQTLKILFPEIFNCKIKKGELYSWGTASAAGSGLVIEHSDSTFSFVNFRTGDIYLTDIPHNTSVCALNEALKGLPDKALHNCYNGTISGPYKFKSWCTK